MLRRGSLLIAVGIALVTGADAIAAGRWNLPSHPAQWMGVGYGPGYHAPMVLGPAAKAWPEYQGVQRIAAPLTVPCQPGAPCFDAGPSTLSELPAVEFAPGPTLAPPQEYYVPAAPAPVPPATAPTPAEPRSPSDKPLPEPLPLPGGSKQASYPQYYFPSTGR